VSATYTGVTTTTVQLYNNGVAFGSAGLIYIPNASTLMSVIACGYIIPPLTPPCNITVSANTTSINLQTTINIEALK
jgi:hypothetical protein